MPKMKTRKAVKKKFKATATGELKRSQPGRRHLLTKKSAKRKRQMRKRVLLEEGKKKTYARIMGVA